MPPKAKGGSKANNPEPRAVAPASDPQPETLNERSKQRFYHTNPAEKRREEVGLSGLTPAEKKTYTHANLVLPVAGNKVQLSNKSEREFWKSVTKEGLLTRRLRRDYSWGKDRNRRDVGTYRIQDFEQRSLKQARLTALDILHRQFLTARELARAEDQDISDAEIEKEKKRRQAMADLKRELYGELTGSIAKDPIWDDVIPIPQNEPEDALAQIAYPEDYAEAVSYLRAVMAVEECSSRALRLTEHVISMNPAHYTVWLYRFKVLSFLKIPIPEEIDWLNAVSLANLKNYQIWHHRQLLMDYYYPTIASEQDTIKKLARTETAFIKQMLEEDTKNYHVWSYRQYLVGKLGMFDIPELGATQNMIEEDVRNNSAWSHRFFLAFSDPKYATPNARPTERDDKIPDSIVDREVSFAKEKIGFAPQNQAAWNYLRGALVKAGRPVSTVTEFAEQFVTALGEEKEEVTSSHALELLAESFKEKGDLEKAKLSLTRLAERWDPVREGYWKYRLSQLDSSEKK